MQTHGTRKNDKLSVALSKKSRKSQNKIKWKQCNIYGNARGILNTSLSEPLYFQRLQNCCCSAPSSHTHQSPAQAAAGSHQHLHTWKTQYLTRWRSLTSLATTSLLLQLPLFLVNLMLIFAIVFWGFFCHLYIFWKGQFLHY